MKISNEWHKRNRRFKIFMIWLIEVDLLIIAKIIFSDALETTLVSDVVKYATYMAGLTVVGLSGVHMIRDWANGKRNSSSKELPKPSEEELEGQ